MKKITKMMKAVMAVMLVAVMAACGSPKIPSAEDVAAKIDKGEALTQTDYTAMIDYVGEYASKAQEYFNTINAQPNDSTADYIKAANEMAELYQKYSYLDMFRTCLRNADMSQFDTANQELINKYANDESFPLPAGEGVALENPKVQGMIQDMPNTDSTPVISTGDGEAVD